MDPNACFEGMLDTFQCCDYELGAERAQDLLDWLGKGGFMPRYHNGSREELIAFCVVLRDQCYRLLSV